jgi:outer membrane protein assembly factor BamB
VTQGVLLAVGPDRVIAWVAPLNGVQELLAFDPDTGATLATQPVPGVTGPDAFAVGDSVIAATEVDSTALTARLVVRSRSTFAVLWSSPAGPEFGDHPGPVLIAGDRLYANMGIGGAPGVAAFALGGCGAAECPALFTAPVPPPPAGTFDSFSASLLAASDDDHLLFRRTSNLSGAIPTSDLVALTTDGDPAWSVRLSTLDGVAIAGDTIYAPATDDSGGAVMAFDTATGALRWRAAGGGGQPIEAGGLVYTELDDPGGTKVAITSADPCGTPTCPALKILDAGTSRSGFLGMSVAEGTLFVNESGVGVLAFTPDFSQA